jgi:hypothetical protein
MSFLRYHNDGTTSKLAVASADGTRERTVAERKSPVFLAGSPAWSPNGRSIATSIFNYDLASGRANPVEFSFRTERSALSPINGGRGSGLWRGTQVVMA